MGKKLNKRNELKYWSYLSVFVIILILTSIFLVNNIKKKQYKEHYQHIKSDVDFISAHIVHHLQSGDYSGVRYFLNNWSAQIHRFDEIKLISKNGFVLVEFNLGEKIKKSIFFSRKINYSYHGEAVLEMYANYDQIDNDIKNVSLIIILIIFLFTLASGFITWLALKKRSLAVNLGKSKDELVLNMKKLENEIIEREKIEKNISRLATVVEQADQTIIVTDLNGNIEYANPAFEKTTGYLVNKVIGRNPSILNGGTLEQVFYQKLWATISSGKTWHGVFHNKRKNGSFYYENSVIFPIKNNNGEIINYAAVKQDITAEKKLQKQLQQSQKMEAIGILAGGIAHDFNNILGVIMGYTDLSMDEVSENKAVCSNLEKVISASERAKDMVQQILSFSRKTDTTMSPIFIRKIINEIVKFLRASIPATIEIRLDIDEELGMIFANGTQINQILMNFCTNAAHAMKDNGGILEISLKNFQLSSDELISDMKPGKYQLLQVKDNGTGIEKKILDKIFEPYFTTKKVGEGTGMGLAVAYGIIKNHHGYIDVSSELGKGTIFNVYFPLMNNEDIVKSEMKEEVILHGNGEQIIFVDDEKELVDIGVSKLEKLGYKVKAMYSSLEVLEAFKSDPDKYDILITDKTMPDMTGLKLREKIHEIRPDLPVIICTGLDNDLNKNNFENEGFSSFIMKPLQRDDLAKAVQNALGKKNGKENCK